MPTPHGFEAQSLMSSHVPLAVMRKPAAQAVHCALPRPVQVAAVQSGIAAQPTQVEPSLKVPLGQVHS